MINLDLFFQALLNGLLIGAVYGVAAIGLSLIWGVLGVVNLAHGSFLILSAYIVFWLFNLLGVTPIAMTVFSLLLGFLVGVVIYSLVGKRIVGQDSSTSLLFFFGASLFISNLILNLWGPDVRGIPWLIQGLDLAGVRISLARLVALMFVSAAFLGLYLLIKYTYYGKAIRAVVINRMGALAVGIDVNYVFALSLGLGLGITFFSGNLIALVNPFTPESGEGYLMYSFASVILGGAGNIIGTMLAGILIGLIESFVGVYFTQGLSPAVAFIILVLVIIVRHRVLTK